MLEIQKKDEPAINYEQMDIDKMFREKYAKKIEELFMAINKEGKITNNKIIKEGIFEIALRKGRDGLE